MELASSKKFSSLTTNIPGGGRVFLDGLSVFEIELSSFS